MQSTVLHPYLEAETPDPVDSFARGPRRREKGAMKGVGFIPVLWVARALRESLLPCSRTVPVALAIADAVDADGRWCFLSHETIVRRCGGTVSRSTVERALDDLADAGLIRRLARSQVRDFFARDVADGVRQADRLPEVLELLIPASVFAEPTLAEINEVRAGLDEEPLDAATRPYPRVGTTPQIEGAPVRSDVRDTSDRRADPSPTHPYPSDPSPSVRTREPEEAAPEPPDGMPDTPAGPLIARIPDTALLSPRADRAALVRAARRVVDEGLEPRELTAVLRDAATARRPFPALMRRLRGPEDARAYLDGRLGAGVARTAVPPPVVPRPRSAFDEPADPFARPPEFSVDAAGTAPRTCPDHPAIRNAPGGTCRVCDRPCRTVPGELMHPPAPPKPPPAAPEPPVEDVAVDPVLLERMRASLDEGRKCTTTVPPSPSALPSPARRKAVSDVRRLLADLRPGG
ncbi:helix-turn-helix domain-containing protein [Nocardiopsis sp. EMB25]|uniref:hypothetical protein n=1 Tax=Nocardiopsis sp. EMB25 TaxID=2835867 RepID=UPI002284257A|nr:hypothetical protein [Nocardiopsis sp. EMB25]MCY9783550.1 helix-turn-helix domain-containing protein [Nocardiopsis sp. EMB25]